MLKNWRVGFEELLWRSYKVNSSYLAEFERTYLNLNFDTLCTKVFEMLFAI